VRPGEVLGTLYSPEFLALVGDYLLAHERAEKATNLASPDAGALQQVAESTRRRLELLGAPASLIERLHASHEMVNELPIASPSVGVITECEAAPGRHVEAGADLFGITNLSSVWTVAHAYERDLGRLRIGQNAKVIANAYPGRVFSARVASLDGSIDEVTRTLRVRLAVTNPDLSLRPGMFVSAHVATGSTREALVVSEGAVQQLGEPVVFVAISDTTFVARPIRSRPLGGNLVEVLEGLRAGERLATTGAFLLKSQALKGELGEE
jgi:Cu(I)/Ag(I) efflux system membrane fusion protein